MRGIIYKDMCLFFRSLDIRMFLIAAAALGILIWNQNVYGGMLASIMAAMLVGCQNVVVYEKEEKVEWGKYQRTLPVKCGQVVAGKYAAVLLTVMVSLLLSVVLNLATFAAYRTFLPDALGLSVFLSLAIPLSWTALSLPFYYWFGFQASQYTSIALIFPLFFFVKNFEDGKWAVPDLMIPLTGHAWIPLIFLSVAALFAISLAVSTVGYCRRQ